MIVEMFLRILGKIIPRRHSDVQEAETSISDFQGPTRGHFTRDRDFENKILEAMKHLPDKFKKWQIFPANLISKAVIDLTIFTLQNIPP